MQPWRPAEGFPQQGDACRCRLAGESRVVDAQGRRDGARRSPRPALPSYGNWANLAQFVRLDRWERRREQGLRDRVRREREAVSLAHTRPAGWPISVTANQPTQATGQVSFRIGGDDPSKRRAPGGALRCGRARFVFQSIREILLQICCRRSHRQQLIQLMIAGLKTGAGRLHPIGKPPQDRFALNEGKGR